MASWTIVNQETARETSKYNIQCRGRCGHQSFSRILSGYSDHGSSNWEYPTVAYKLLKTSCKMIR